MKKDKTTKVVKSKRDNFRGSAEYKSLALFVVGTIGFLLTIYIGFGLIMVAIKADRLVNGQKISKRVPSEVGTVRRDIESEKIGGMDKNQKKIDVIVKEVFGKVTSVNEDVIRIETKVYGEDMRNVRLKFADENKGGIFEYQIGEDGEDAEVEMKLEDLKEGMYVGVKLPVEILLSEIEKDLIYVDNIVVDTKYKEDMQE